MPLYGMLSCFYFLGINVMCESFALWGDRTYGPMDLIVS
jgi:hypothetical protein